MLETASIHSLILLCATSVSSVSLWLSYLKCDEPQRHREHRGHTEKSRLLLHNHANVRTDLPWRTGLTTGRRRSSRRHAQDSPDPTVEMERLERAIQEITRHAESSSGSAFRQEVEMSAWSNSRLRANPVRKRIAPNDLRPTHVRRLFPNMSMQQVRIVARVTTGMQHANAKLLSRRRREHRSHRIATNLRIRQDIREIKFTRLFEWRIRSEAHAFPERLRAIVDGLLPRVFRIFCFGKIRHGDAIRSSRFAVQAVETKIYVVLKYRHKLAEDRAVRSRDIDLCARFESVVPLRSLRLDDEPADR